MFEHFAKRSFHLALYRNGPYAEERSRFLAILIQEGRCLGRLKRFNELLLQVARQIALSSDRCVSGNNSSPERNLIRRSLGLRARLRDGARALERKQDSFIPQFFEACGCEPKQLCWLPARMLPFAERFQDAQERKLAAEVALVELPAKDCFIHGL